MVKFGKFGLAMAIMVLPIFTSKVEGEFYSRSNSI
jgi:hypothetical protein